MSSDLFASDWVNLLDPPELHVRDSTSATVPSEPTKPLLARSPRDRRAHPRFSADDLWWLRSPRLKYGASVDVIDLSISGALLETDVRLQLGSNLVLEFVGLEGPMMVPLRILRCQVSRLVGGVRYHGACAFKRPLDLPVPVAGPVGAPVDRRQALRVDQVLQSIVGTYARRGTVVDSLRTVFSEAQEVIDYLKRLQTIAARRSSEYPFDALIIRLIEDVMSALHRRDRWDTAREALEDRLCQLLPQFKIGIVHSPSPTEDGQVESVHFALERLGTLPAQFLNIEIPPNSTVEDAHFRLLKAASYLLTLLRLWDFRRMEALKSVEANTVDSEMKPEDANVLQFAVAGDSPQPAAQMPMGWNKVVVRYLDGELTRGYSYDFHPTRQQFCIWPSMTAEPTQRRVVHLAHLKAVFFVRELEGNPTYNERKAFDRPTTGRRLEVTFLDGEVLVGSTMNYQPHGPGFFLLPADPGSNNIRTFVVSGSTRHVRFL